VIAAAITAIALATVVGLTLWQSRVARLERDKAQAVSGFLVNLIQSGGPEREKFKGKGIDLKVVDLLDDSAAMISRTFSNQPDIQIEMRHTLAVAYLGLGAWDKARKEADIALALARKPKTSRSGVPSTHSEPAGGDPTRLLRRDVADRNGGALAPATRNNQDVGPGGAQDSKGRVVVRSIIHAQAAATAAAC
jgi:hypothetical protein